MLFNHKITVLGWSNSTLGTLSLHAHKIGPVSSIPYKQSSMPSVISEQKAKSKLWLPLGMSRMKKGDRGRKNKQIIY